MTAPHNQNNLMIRVRGDWKLTETSEDVEKLYDYIDHDLKARYVDVNRSIEVLSVLRRWKFLAACYESRHMPTATDIQTPHGQSAATGF